MSIKISASKDNAGELGPPQNGAGSATVPVGVVNGGGAIRDLLINYNAEIGASRNRFIGNPAWAISTNFDVKNANAVTYTLAGVLATISVNTNFDTGTTAVIAADKWGIAILTYDGSTATVTWSSATPSYATEALAIAALGQISTLIPASGFSCGGYFTVQTGSGVTWTAGTDALAGGTGGTPATTTNYYNDPTLNGTYGGWQIGTLLAAVITQ